MRVITGTAKGRKLSSPAGWDTRPTTDMVKEAVFSIVQFEVEGANVLDLFAGTGQMGIEALSRGAKHCVFVDQAKSCQTVIRENLKHTGLEGRARVAGADAVSYLKSAGGPFDIVFLDPPYGKGLAVKALSLLGDKLRQGGAVLCETEREEEMPDSAGGLQKVREYRYGKKKVTLYRMLQEEAD